MIMPHLALLLLLCACDDELYKSWVAVGEIEGQGYCGVVELSEQACSSCHSASAALGGLDLETSLASATLGVESPNHAGRVLVVAGDPDQSFLYLKAAGLQESDEGDLMPPGLGLEPELLELIHDWIADGADTTCGDSGVP
jgi:hypothetical protein